MRVTKASLWRLAALTLVAGSALAVSSKPAKADWLNGLSVRVGFLHPVRDTLRDMTDFAAWGGGIDYKVPWFPNLFNGAGWGTSLSADFHYSERKAGILRYIPVSINQTYTFEPQNGMAPYAGICLTAATFGTTVSAGSASPRQPTVTRFGGGVILGLNFTHNLYVEGRYEWFDPHHAVTTPEGFRGYVGYRF